MQGFWKKSAELEVIFNSCWVLEIQNEVSANQRGSSINHIGRFGGLDVISGIIGDRFIDPKTMILRSMNLSPMIRLREMYQNSGSSSFSYYFLKHRGKGHGDRYISSLFRVDEPVPDDSNLKTFVT